MQSVVKRIYRFCDIGYNVSVNKSVNLISGERIEKIICKTIFTTGVVPAAGTIPYLGIVVTASIPSIQANTNIICTGQPSAQANTVMAVDTSSINKNGIFYFNIKNQTQGNFDVKFNFNVNGVFDPATMTALSCYDVIVTKDF